MFESAVYSVTPGAQAGFVWMGGILDPAVWSGTPQSLVRVQTPALPFGGTGKAIAGNQLVGDNSSPLHGFLYNIRPALLHQASMVCSGDSRSAIRTMGRIRVRRFGRAPQNPS